ncbi:UPF0547 protein C16orf87 homolog [Pocillopora verrucosa]|uniref:UPF0547 protein C16orf87 homolog n=1 Tax=Pocillopora verrucosa TaxID=203993 RepID=UPI002796F898|nr:UPF0547 protein C16orf87 homolog [Pocillopora verrucosa]
MVLRQCLACNSTVLGTLQICTCGHVFEDVRQIGGKRFSVYRASLYTRLEAKKMKFRGDESKTQSDPDSSEDCRSKQVALKTKKGNIGSSSSSKVPRKKGRRRGRNGKNTHENRRENKAVSLFYSPEEEAERFSQALQEINRRIMGQSLVWLL